MPVDETLAQQIENAAEQVTKEAEAEVNSEVSNTQDSSGTSDSGDVDSDMDGDVPGSNGDDGQSGVSEELSDESSQEQEVESSDKDQDLTEDDFSVPDLSDEIIAKALTSGMSMTDILSFPDEDSLSRVIAHMGDRVVSGERKTELASDDPFAELKLDPEKYEPEVVEMFEKMTKVLKNQNEQLETFKQQQEETNRATQMSVAQEVERWFDKQVENLGEDFVDALGSGGYSSLKQGSSQLANREAIANQMAVILAGHEALGLGVPPREEIFDMATSLVLADKFEELHEKELAGNLQKQAGQHIQRVSGVKAKSVKTPEEETAALIDEKFG